MRSSSGPWCNAELYGKVSGFAHGLLGGEHSGGESQTPDISFAGGAGGGLEYKLGPRLSLRASGDEIASSFSLIGNSKALGYFAPQALEFARILSASCTGSELSLSRPARMMPLSEDATVSASLKIV